MPKNKKPRKKMRRADYAVTQTSITKPYTDYLQSEFWRVQAVAELKLQYGKCIAEDLWCMRDMFNLVGVAWLCRTDLDEEALAYAVPKHKAGAEALHNVTVRGQRNGDRFVCSGDELRAILDGLEVCGQYIEYFIAHTPRQFTKEYFAMIKICLDKKGAFSVSEDAIKREINEVNRVGILPYSLTIKRKLKENKEQGGRQ